MGRSAGSSSVSRSLVSSVAVRVKYSVENFLSSSVTRFFSCLFQKFVPRFYKNCLNGTFKYRYVWSTWLGGVDLHWGGCWWCGGWLTSKKLRSSSCSCSWWWLFLTVVCSSALCLCINGEVVDVKSLFIPLTKGIECEGCMVKDFLIALAHEDGDYSLDGVAAPLHLLKSVRA